MMQFLWGALLSTTTILSAPFFVPPTTTLSGRLMFGIPIPYLVVSPTEATDAGALGLADLSNADITIVAELLLCNILIFTLTFMLSIKVSDWLWTRVTGRP